MKKNLLFLFLIVISYHVTARNAQFTLCKSQFALCTTALCEATKKKGWVSCHCSVQDGYSVGAKACSKAKGLAIKSRYYPIKSYAICKNNRSWAWCLDSSCTIDKKDPKKANCLCSVVKNKGDYIIVTDTYSKNTCTSGLYSSATVEEVNQATDFLKRKKELKPFSIKVLNE